MKNKILIISIIFVLISFIFVNNNVFASSSNTVTVNDNTYILPEGVTEYCIVNTYGGAGGIANSISLLYSTNDINNWKQYGVASNYFTICNYTDSTFSTYQSFYIITIDNSTFDFTTTDPSTWTGNWAVYDIIYSTFDVYDVSGTEIFFQKAPVTETVLTPILEEVEMMEPTMKEILILLPIMIILIVSYLALRKGLAFLKILRKM